VAAALPHFRIKPLTIRFNLIQVQAVGVMKAGGPVEPLELPGPPAPGPDEVLIEVEAAGVGNWDRFAQDGSWDVGIEPPMALGVEAAGVVVEAGADSGFEAGDEVMTYCVPLRHQGTWAERLLAGAATVAPKPAQATWEEAGAFPVPVLTASQALGAAAPQDGEWLLVVGAGGVTGELVVRLALRRGARVIATAGPRSSKRLPGMEVDIIDHRAPGWVEKVRELTGGTGARATVNAKVGGAAEAMSATSDGGRLATITGDPPAAERGIAISSVYVRADGAELAELGRLLGDGTLSVPIFEQRPLTDAAAALATVAAGHAGGAIVLRLE
jgi:NADPH:quinone reductase-like Zn-dependent oxidoreductase